MIHAGYIDNHPPETMEGKQTAYVAANSYYQMEPPPVLAEQRIQTAQSVQRQETPLNAGLKLEDLFQIGSNKEPFDSGDSVWQHDNPPEGLLNTPSDSVDLPKNYFRKGKLMIDTIYDYDEPPVEPSINKISINNILVQQGYDGSYGDTGNADGGAAVVERGNDVIINSYMRSGSSFLGQLLGYRSDTFYVYEPLWNIQKLAFYYGDGHICHYFNSECYEIERNRLQVRETSMTEAITYLNSLLDCSFYKPREFLPDMMRFPVEFKHITQSWNFCKADSWDVYKKCAAAESSFDFCIETIKPVCSRYKHRVLKIIRSTLDNYEQMLEKRSNLKVIQLFRDPRGLLNSQLNTKFLMNKLTGDATVEAEMRVHCVRMQYDITVSERFLAKYPDRFRVAQYEDFADIVGKGQSLYRFTGMVFNDDIKAMLIKTQIKPGESRNGFHPYEYTRTLPWRLERLIYPHCKDVYEALGYPIFQNEQDYINYKAAGTYSQLKYPF